MSDAPSQTQDKFIVRLPDGLRGRIKSAAEANNRSMNAEIVATLEERYPAPVPVSPAYDEMYGLMDHIDAAVDDEDAERRLQKVNESLKALGRSLRLKLSGQRSASGSREIFMTFETPKRAGSQDAD
ncbi:Arc family DNA-binding protein [Cereibacter changlensis]|uniref:Arc family DNA-binding protein n=1 Tax=Cereibacter changlensis TaxID=402884 RepID=A0A4U0Z5H2_9RHOB|nr:Arc family DNA-binding protein [Cereibacter changlensis]TKA98536.1 Arc family DNA-binding protein [Cereibacter changlensis]